MPSEALREEQERLVKKEQIKAYQSPLLNIVKMLTSRMVPKNRCSLETVTAVPVILFLKIGYMFSGKLGL